MTKRTVLLGMLSLGMAMTARAEPPVGVTPIVIGRATYDAFNLQSDRCVLEFSAQAKRPVDIVVRTHDYAIRQPVRAVFVEPVNPVAQRLPVHLAD